MSNLGNEIKKQRIAKGLTVEELSDKTMLSVAIINDLENGAFKLYEGDETYVKMYLKKISRALDMDFTSLEGAYLQVTEEIKHEELEKVLREEELKQENIQKRKDFKFERPNYSSNRNVYQSSRRLNMTKVVIVIVAILAFISLGYGTYSLVLKNNNTTSQVTEKKTTQNKTPKQNNKTNNTEKKDNDVSNVKEEISFTRLGVNRYQFKVTNTETIRVKIVFGQRTWAGFRINNKATSLFTDKTYQANEEANATIKVSEFNVLRVRNGVSKGTKYYINDVEVPLSSDDASLSTATIYFTLG